MKHPSQSDLALYAGGDLAFWSSLALRWHLKTCERCRQQAEAFATLRADLETNVAELPAGMNWAALEAEMRANIRLGLAAGEIAEHTFPGAPEAEIVEQAPPPPARLPVRSLTWSLSAPLLPGVAVLASLSLVVALVWMLSHPPVSYAPQRAQNLNAPVLSAWGPGVEVSYGGAALTLLPPTAKAAGRSVDLGAGARAEYVDAETGQVTIHQVFYGDEQ